MSEFELNKITGTEPPTEATRCCEHCERQWFYIDNEDECPWCEVEVQSRLVKELGVIMGGTNAKLQALGSAWRGSWADFDGRTLRMQLNDIVKGPTQSLTSFCEQEGICKHLSWRDDCSTCRAAQSAASSETPAHER